jgi:hypothetical protein
MDTPLTPPNPEKILAFWMEWERGETMPGKVMTNLKTAGLPILLQQIIEQRAAQS